MKSVRRVCLGVLFLALPFSTSSIRAQIITTVAGTTKVFRGDGGPAVNATLGPTQSVALDRAGNVLVADDAHAIVAKITPGGTLSIVAGNGITGFSGDGGPATSASLNGISGLAVDGSGNLYIADFFNNRIRKVDAGGVITTVAGDGVARYSGDGGQALAASLYEPIDVAVDSAGSIYIADSRNARVRKVSTGGIITTVAGTGVRGISQDGGPATAAMLVYPNAVAVDSAGNLYIADNSRIRKVSPAGTIGTVAGGGAASSSGDGGPATNAQLLLPAGVTVDSVGNLYICEGNRIRKVTTDGVINTVAGGTYLGFSGDGGPATSAQLYSPRRVAVDNAGNFWVADTINLRVRKVAAGGTISTVAGRGTYGFSGDGGPATTSTLVAPIGIAIDSSGNTYIADQGNHRVRKISSNGTISTVAGNGSFSFSLDGGMATSTAVPEPAGIALDRNGNLYIAEPRTSRIRKVSPSGIITTVAGIGQGGYNGDGFAVFAALGVPNGVAVDASGNLYIADTYNLRIRKVTPFGVITTIAGNGNSGSTGDGGPATAATVGLVWSVAVDAAGNVYFPDGAFNRVRKIGTDGTITTVAGTGDEGFSGDGGQATAAKLSIPYAATVDPSGNLYIADTGNYRIRKVTPGGAISTIVGTGIARFSGDGGPATAAGLNSPAGLALDGAGNLFISDSGNDRVRKLLLATPPSFSVAPATLTFSLPGGSTSSTPQQITVSGSLTGLLWGAQASTDSGGNWLLVSPAAGSTPGAMSVTVNAANLAPGTYRGRITVDAPGATPGSQSVGVDLTVQTTLPAKLSVEPASVSFEMPAGTGNPPAATLRISNAGGGALNWTAQAATTSGGNWLSVSAASGTASPGSPSTIQINAGVAGLAPGVYSGSVRVQSPAAGQEQTVAVTLLVTKITQTILVSQTGLAFTGVEGGGVVPSQSVGILNIGQGTMNWTVQAQTLSGGNWLTVSPGSGRSDADSTQIPFVEIGANVTGMPAGLYGGLIRVTASGADNSPQLISVHLNVLPAGSNPGVLVRPTGLIFATRAGTSSPSSQTVRVGTASPGGLETRVFGATFDRGNWLQTVPDNLSLSSGDARSITVQPALGSLAPQLYRGALTLLFADGTPSQTVDVLFLVVGSAGTGGGGLEAMEHRETGLLPLGGNCTPQKLIAAFRSLTNSFTASIGWPSLIEAQVMDDCGTLVANAGVVASFSNGDPPLVLASLRNGNYTGTWLPSNAATQVSVTLRAILTGYTPAEVKAQGQLGANLKTPALYSGGIVSGASFAPRQALAPGSIVSVFGANMAKGLNAATRVPLDTSLGGATLNIGGVDAPLFFTSDGQINAQVPFELTPNARHSVVLKSRRDGTGAETAAVPEIITVAAAQPAIFTINQQGTGQGAILDTDGRLVDGSAPARVGDILQVFCTGLGATQPAVKSGERAPAAEPLARVAAAVEARIDGKLAVVHFAGLAPGFVGLYQVNVQIPADATPGNSVSLVLLQNGTPSNTVTIALQ